MHDQSSAKVLRFCYMPCKLLSTHVDRQRVDRSFTVCLFVCNFVRLRISPARIKLAASNFTRWFIGVLSTESPILGNFSPPTRSPISDQSATTWKYCLGCISLPRSKLHATDAPFVKYRAAYVRRSACVDIRPSPKTDVLV